MRGETHARVTGDNLREEILRMEKERNSIVGIFRSWLVSAKRPRRQKEDVISIGVDINWERRAHPRGSTRLQLNRASRYLLMAMTVYTSGCTRRETGSMRWANHAEAQLQHTDQYQGSDPAEVWCEHPLVHSIEAIYYKEAWHLQWITQL